MRQTVKMMGTKIDLLVEHDEAAAIIAEVIALLKVYEHRFSANDSRSELSVINQNSGERSVAVHPELYDLIKIGVGHSKSAKSYLNIAIGPLIQLWRVGFKDACIPLHFEIEAALTLTDIDQVHLNDQKQSVFLAQKGMQIDLGALAKGYIADRIKELLVQRGVQSAFINLGGNLLTLGKATHHEDGYWRIGIQNPFETRGHHACVLKIQDQSIVTSGIYERQYTAPTGEVFHHIFDRYTGYPISTEIASLSIISTLSIDGEIWTTRLFGLPKEKILLIVEQLPEIECIIITQKKELYYSSGIPQMLMGHEGRN